jgi:alkanesulfonate monooxygenase SsuD/methylene tetrahydromethanopterin reductase-like flavin-dependent oxidoreductase (luciferase family)
VFPLHRSGDSSDGRDLAARNAEGIYTNAETLEEAQAFYADIQQRTAAAGRNPRHVTILPGLVPIIAATDEEARQREAAINGAVDLKKALVQLGRPFNYHDFSAYPLDAPFPDLGGLGLNGYRGAAERIQRVARDEKLTLRQTALRFAARPSPFVGSARTVADEMERWFKEGGCDGFNFRVSVPSEFDAFIHGVLPLLRQRGLVRQDYEGSTLREHLGLPFPQNRYAAARAAA